MSGQSFQPMRSSANHVPISITHAWSAPTIIVTFATAKLTMVTGSWLDPLTGILSTSENHAYPLCGLPLSLSGPSCLVLPQSTFALFLLLLLLFILLPPLLLLHLVFSPHISDCVFKLGGCGNRIYVDLIFGEDILSQATHLHNFLYHYEHFRPQRG